MVSESSPSWFIVDQGDGGRRHENSGGTEGSGTDLCGETVEFRNTEGTSEVVQDGTSGDRRVVVPSPGSPWLPRSLPRRTVLSGGLACTPVRTFLSFLPDDSYMEERVRPWTSSGVGVDKGLLHRGVSVGTVSPRVSPGTITGACR